MVFKVATFWNTFTPQVATRVLRDSLAIQRLARVNRADFVIACDQELHPTLLAMGIPVTVDLVNPNMVRAYLVGDDLTDELQDRLPDCEDTEIITLTPISVPGGDESEVTDVDPYGGVKLFKDWKAIPETMPLDKAPPKGPPEQIYSPFL